ncbi:MAG: methyltransferase domain-containing protein [Actinomycetota bacterium]|nr:methyltransferase domain-containing protein [Actinomycetota bacterium]
MSPTDPEQYRATSRARWAEAAGAWGAYRHVMQAAGDPVSHWMVDAIDPQPGHHVLELAAGPGDTGFLAAELIEPGGTLISSDAVEEMVDQARARAAELGIANVEFRTIDAEWIDLPTADLDGVLARWGYMLLADPATALRETRRVLRPGGRVALAAWADPVENLWASAPPAELVAMGAIEPPDLDEPNMFAFRDPQHIVALLEETGFEDIVVEQVPIVFSYASLDDWWDTMLDISTSLARNVGALTPARRDDLRDALDARLAQYVDGDGAVALPGLTHVAAAGA